MLHNARTPATSTRPPFRRRRARAGLAFAAAPVLAALGGLTTTAAADPGTPGSEPYRPAIHYTPAQNWMNDPNGLVYHDGTYHLYYQHNPKGNTWGNMSWGHATSPDLMRWTEQPLAIPQTFNEAGQSVEDIFSGSVVVDHENTSGFGTAEDPPLVAMYTSAYTAAHPTLAGRQAQSLAYSTDGGYTWTKYEGNPVIDRGSANFRDPKVFWYDGGSPETSHWVMVAVEATEYRVVLYKSENLKDWEYLSDFGPANATGGIWEVPDLFELPVDGDPENTRWVLVVNLNPGAVAGGSGAQYFVGDFDGTTFTSESTVEGVTVPEGDVIADFEGTDWAGWTVTNEPGHPEQGPFGPGPYPGTVPGQQTVSGYVGERLVNSFVGHDHPVGSLESPTFTLEKDYLSLLVGGGRHPHVPGGQLGNEPPAGTLLFDGFEQRANGGTLADAGWVGTGDLQASNSPSTAGGEYYIGDGRLNTWEGGPRGDDNVGTLTSPTFTLDGDHLSMLVGGGRRADDDPQTLQVQLLVDGQVVRHLTGPENGALNWRSWDISDLRGRQAQLRVVDQATGGWGHLTLDHVVIGDEPATPRTDETTVNLVVDGAVVRTATGTNSERLDWVSWDVRDLVGKQASIRVVDNNRSGWGHVLLDQVMATDTPQPRGVEQYDWLDWGRDYYATISFDNAPDGKRLMIGWMNDWTYATSIPTSPWRSAMALPREVTLTEIDGEIQVRQHVVDQVKSLAIHQDAYRTRNLTVTDETVPLPVTGDVYQVDVTIDPGDAERAGIAVRTSDGFAADPAASADGAEGTVIAYDADSRRVVVDRARSGDVSFHPDFAGASSAPVRNTDGTVTFRAYVDRSSVEVFADDGLRALTSQVFPDPGSLGISAFAQGGSATIQRLTVTPLETSVHVPGPNVSLTARSTCANGTAWIEADVTGDDATRVHARLETPLGDRTRSVAAGETARIRIPSGGTALDAGTVALTATAQSKESGTTTQRAAYEPITCTS